MLEIDPDKVFFIILESRMINAEAAELDRDDDAGDIRHDKEHIIATYAAGGAEPHEQENTPAYEQLKSYLDSLSDDDQINLVALMWIGRGTFSKAEWQEAVEIATDEHNQRTSNYLLGTPLLADYLEAGLSEFDYSLEEAESRLL